MRTLLNIVVLAAIGLTASCSTVNSSPALAANEQPVSGGEKRPVLVELFTSEGCSSCPPADKVLITLSRDQRVEGAKVIALGFHVDYWNGIGWKDRFSSQEYTRRQEAYAKQFKEDQTYTPQMVVDGVDRFVGNNKGAAFNSIAAAGQVEKGTVQLSQVAGKLHASFASLSTHGEARVFLAVAEDGLESKVSGGENRGEDLTHAAVVRSFKQIGAIPSSAKNAELDIEIPNDADWKLENVRYVVFAQDADTLKVLAVDQINAK